jgi:hypothetical protein
MTNRELAEEVWEKMEKTAYDKDLIDILESVLSRRYREGIEAMRYAAKVDETLTGHFLNTHLDEIAARLLKEGEK